MRDPPCKICGEPAPILGSLDFSKSCEDRQRPVFPPSGEQVTYRRCARCGLVFTTHFDDLSDADMTARIYNADYIKVDPEFADERPRYFADILSSVLEAEKSTLRVLDYGGGTGVFARMLLERGFAGAESYDPYFGSEGKPSRRFELVTCFEVAEHVRAPLETFKDAVSFVDDDGVLLFSTTMQPRNVTVGWWYIAPRNGHITIYSERSLARIAAGLRVHFLPLDAGIHLFYRNPRSRLVRAFLRHFAYSALYAASLRGSWPLTKVSLAAASAGFLGAAANPKHILRAFLGPRGRA